MSTNIGGGRDCPDPHPTTNPCHTIEQPTVAREEEGEGKEEEEAAVTWHYDEPTFFLLLPPLGLSLPQDRFFTHKESGGKE